MAGTLHMLYDGEDYRPVQSTHVPFLNLKLSIFIPPSSEVCASSRDHIFSSQKKNQSLPAKCVITTPGPQCVINCMQRSLRAF